jgi:hypothetical protein
MEGSSHEFLADESAGAGHRSINMGDHRMPRELAWCGFASAK